MTGDKINIKIKPLGILDLLAFKNLVPGRKKRIQKAPATVIDSLQPVNALACKLHPSVQHLIVGKYGMKQAMLEHTSCCPIRK